MTPTQIAKAQALATEWWERHNNYAAPSSGRQRRHFVVVAVVQTLPTSENFNIAANVCRITK